MSRPRTQAEVLVLFSTVGLFFVVLAVAVIGALS